MDGLGFKNMSSIEVEVRGLLKEEEFHEIMNFLKHNSRKHWEDNKETTFFIIPNTNLKVTKNITDNTAKIAYKSGTIDNTSNVEIEFKIDPEDVSNAVKIFRHLGFSNVIESKQRRTNFDYKNVDIALKFSQEWGYHFEMEVMVEKDDQVADAMNKIDLVCEELGIKYMTDDEIRKFSKEIQRKYKK